MPRDDFSQAVKLELARRAAHRCSRPDCRAATSGPSETSRSRASNVGVAAHITAAAPGGPRYDETLDPEVRHAVDNGVWLCQSDAKLIDDDTQRFTPELLRAWRSSAERLAAEEQGRPLEPTAIRPCVIVELSRRLSVDAEQLRGDIAYFLSDVGATVAWAAHAQLAYMTLYEIAINAIEHGGATELWLKAAEGVVTLSDDGHPFGLTELRSGGRGGNLVVTTLEDAAAGELSLRYRRADRNVWSLVDELATGGAGAPCSIALGLQRPQAWNQARDDLLMLDDCEEIHIYAPAWWSISDWYSLQARLEDVLGERPVIIHGVDRRSLVYDMLTTIFPTARTLG